MKNILSYLFAFASILTLSCNKEAFLDKKPSTAILVPTTLADIRGLLDNTTVFIWTPGIGEMSADNYYMTSTNWQAQTDIIRNAYSWEKDIMGSVRSLNDWGQSYTQVLYANIALEQSALLLPSASDLGEWNDIKGTAFFQRGYSFYKLVVHFAGSYDSSSAATDPGIPLKLNSDIHTYENRASVKDSYNQIFTDLNAAVRLLSDNVPVTMRNRPSKPAVYALLSRICLAMRRYDAAQKYADSCLNLYSKLINYNTVSVTATTPFDKSNDENIFYSSLSDYTVLSATSTVAFIDTTLYQSYVANDLRKTIYFRTISGTNIGMKRGYTGTIYGNGGLCVDEMYLNRAECLARAGNTVAALSDLNTLLVKRWKTGTYVNVTATSSADALSKILVERRKELIWRGLRWIDIKRLNKEGAGISLNRSLNGTTYTLTANSQLFVFPIPDNEIALSGISQNPR